MSRRGSRRFQQRTFELLQWGGVRPGAGAKKKSGSGVSHLKRAEFPARFPVHVTARLVNGLSSLRRRPELAALRAAFRAGCEREGFRLIHYSVQSNHVHMLVEAESRQHLSRSLQGLFVRMARALNRLWARAGRVFSDRYHDRILSTPRQVRNALAYVLCNARKHGLRLPPGASDPFSSGEWFDGWSVRAGAISESSATSQPAAIPVIARAKTWLLNVGWRRHGRLNPAEIPGSA